MVTFGHFVKTKPLCTLHTKLFFLVAAVQNFTQKNKHEKKDLVVVPLKRGSYHQTFFKL
jgi:hypothetical protein